LDERQQLRWRASSESYFSSSCMGCIGNPENTSETRVVEGSNPVFQSSGQGPCFRTVEEDCIAVLLTTKTYVWVRPNPCCP